ncbi:MAG TPA: hypothetical protein VEQ61_07675 [Thermoleophilaceae bacterium]|nr:hypothetical protein [Thermoleophilaceae bacterium]
MEERTSWLAIVPGWDVVDSAGSVIGEVTSVVGDPDSDIFDGLRLRTGDGEERYAPGERVGDIFEGRVTIHAELHELGDPADEAPGGVEVSRDRDAEL